MEFVPQKKNGYLWILSPEIRDGEGCTSMREHVVQYTITLFKNCKLRFDFASQIIMWSRRAQGSGGVSCAWQPVWVCRCMCIWEVSSEQPVTVVLFSNHFWLALSSSDNTLAWSAPYFFFFTFWFNFFHVNDYDNPAVCCLFDVIFCLCLMILFDFVDAQSIYQ